MNLPYSLGTPLNSDQWERLKLKTVFECCKWDVQSEDHCVLCDFPLLLDASAWKYLSKLAEQLAAEAAAAESELLSRPELHASLGIQRRVRRELARAYQPSASLARTMRFDFHCTDEGWRISEINADVPGGFIEAGGFTELMSVHFGGTTTPPNPADAYAKAIASHCGSDATVAMVHATAYTDDRQVMQYLAKRLVARGARVYLAGPAHLAWQHATARLSCAYADQRVDSVVRFYPAEWLPNLSHKHVWLPYFQNSRTPISNPATAVLVQSKRFPLVWDKLRTQLPTWRALLPETRCPGEFGSWKSDEWVVKPAFGRVGEDLGIPGVTPEPALRRIYKAAQRRPFGWIAQRRFRALPSLCDSGEYYPTIGVYTIDGRAAGAYGRIARKPLIDHDAQDIAVLISSGDQM